MEEIFFELGMLIAVSAVIAFILRALKQPLIPAYIITGVLLGPVLGILTDTKTISLYSEIGIAFLLFMVGLEIDLKKLKDVGRISTLGGIIQVALLFIVGFAAAVFLGFMKIEAVYIGLIIALSSTMIVVKLLSDKRELDTLHGRIILGILLMQDIIAILAVSVLTTLGKFSALVFLFSLIKGLLVLSSAWFCSRHLFPKLFSFAAKSRQLLFLSSISVCFVFAILFNNIGEIVAYIIKAAGFTLSESIIEMLKQGFSISVGAFVAGVTLANLPYNVEIVGRVKPLKDFFATIFFVSLGLELSIYALKEIAVPFLVFLLIIILVKPLVVLLLCSFFGYTKRTGFTTAVSLAQISEFSLIIVAQGLLMGHVSQNIFFLTVLLAVVTISMTSYFMKYDNYIYSIIGGKIKFLDRFTKSQSNLDYLPKSGKQDFILCGYNRIGYSVVKTITRMKKRMVVVDFNPEVIKSLAKQKISCIYGDIGDLEVLERLDLNNAKMIIATVPTKADNILLIKKTREVNKDAVVMVTANQVNEALEYYDSGADYVILPHFLGGDHVSVLIESFDKNVEKVVETKLRHVEELRRRQELGHEHPKHQN